MGLFHVAYNGYVWKTLFLYRHPERSRGIFLAHRYSAVCVIAGKWETFSERSKERRSARKISRCARNDSVGDGYPLYRIKCALEKCSSRIVIPSGAEGSFSLAVRGRVSDSEERETPPRRKGSEACPQCHLSIYFHSTPCISNNYLFFQFGILEIHASKKAWRK